MDINTDPYLSRPVRAARAVAIVASWTIWLVAVGVAVTSRIPQGVLGLLLLSGFAPYIASIQFVEPWLIRRIEAASGRQPRGRRGDD